MGVSYGTAYIKTAILKGSNLFIPRISLKPYKQLFGLILLSGTNFTVFTLLGTNILNIPQSIIK